MSKIIDSVEKWLEPLLAEHGMELYFAEYVKEGRDRVLRVYIDKEGGVSSDDCAIASNFISNELDKNDPIEDSYLLEVSSPGIERELRKDAHFEKNIGKTIKLSLFTAFEGSKSYEGELIAYSSESIRLRQKTTEVEIPRDKVSKARIVFHYN